MLLDPQDESARALLKTSGQDEAIAAHVAEGRRRGYVSSFTWGMPRTVAVKLLAEAFDEIAAMVAVPGREGDFWLIAIRAGSASATLMPPVRDTGV